MTEKKKKDNIDFEGRAWATQPVGNSRDINEHCKAT
jgi:hypothetical protein